MTWFELVAVAVAVDVFACVVGAAVGAAAGVLADGCVAPSSGMKIWISVPRADEPFGSAAFGATETVTLAFVGATCSEVDVAFAFWVVGAL